MHHDYSGQADDHRVVLPADDLSAGSSQGRLFVALNTARGCAGYILKTMTRLALVAGTSRTPRDLTGFDHRITRNPKQGGIF